MEETWSELFLLNAIQWCMPLDVSASPLFNINEHAKNGNSTTDVRILAGTLIRFKSVHVDPAEFACLKAIVLFRAGNSTNEMKLLLNLNSYLRFQILGNTLIRKYLEYCIELMQIHFNNRYSVYDFH